MKYFARHLLRRNLFLIELMDTQHAYNLWAGHYDSDENKTRDCEAISLRETLAHLHVAHCLEIGCGTGKNTEWLASKAQHVTAVDLSEKMLSQAQAKIQSVNVQFHQADITAEWNFVTKPYDLITFSLVLEHIENLDAIFQKTAQAVAPGGYVYIGELHPFKQYSGTKARFTSEEGQQVLTCFNHHISDFTQSAQRHGLFIVEMNEYFDDNNRNSIPRILTLLLRKAENDM
jgi:2-polyprenyl-3-methyl-5-hydroxy-6-metoxy-1,4-benzoquinol methylase